MSEKNTVICNACGRTIYLDNGAKSEDALVIKKDWGFFSEKDLETHEFVLCESCYDNITENFCKKVSVSETKEIFRV